jgi:perosamine synthetase
MRKIPLIKPFITENVKEKVGEVLDSGYLTEGPVTREFEEEFERYIGCSRALAMTSCTTGLEIALRALEVGKDDEVIIPDYTYPATGHVVGLVGARAVIVDVSKGSMLIDYDQIEEAISQRTKAIIPVSLFGNPLNYQRLSEIRDKYGVHLIEDAACSIGAEFKGIRAGNLADISVFSLHPRKFITTGEGGMVTTNNSDWADWMLSYKHFGMGVHDSRLTTSFEQLGTNYKLSDILAAVGLEQMKHIDELLSKRRLLAQKYVEYLKGCPHVMIPEITPKGVHSYQSFCLFVENRNQVMQKLRNQGIEAQIGTYSLHMHKAFKQNPNCKIMGDMVGSRYAYDHCMALPLYHDLTTDDQEYVVERLSKCLIS